MTLRTKRLIALLTVVAFGHTACYNYYFINKDELEKLESGVKVQRQVEVEADCPESGNARAADRDRARLAQSESKGNSETATDATKPKESTNGESETAGGCTTVPVSTANALSVVTDDGTNHRVTPFNFMMSERQLVSPEYDLLLSLDRVEGAEVREFSTWKTIGMITGVSAVSIGLFVGISVVGSQTGGGG